MRILTIKEIAELDPGEVVPAFRCQIKETKPIGPKQRGTNDYGEWSIQKLTVMDATGIMTLKVWNKPEFTRDWQGVWVVVQSVANDKGVLSGIRVVEDTYRDKTTKQIEAKENATIAQATDAAPAPETAAAQKATLVQQPPPQQTAPAPTPAPAQAATVAPKGNGQQAAPERQRATADDVRKQIVAAKERLGQAANGLILCYDAALYVANEVTKRHQEVVIPLFGPDQIEKLAVHLSITLERGGLVFGLPVGSLDAWTKRAKASESPPVDQTGYAEGGVG